MDKAAGGHIFRENRDEDRSSTFCSEHFGMERAVVAIWLLNLKGTAETASLASGGMLLCVRVDFPPDAQPWAYRSDKGMAPDICPCRA